MWFIYYLDDFSISSKHYSKLSAKKEMRYLNPDFFGIAKIKVGKYEEWKMWKLLGGKDKVKCG